MHAHVCVYFLGKLFIVFFSCPFSLFDRVDFFNSAGYQGRVGSESPTRRVAVNFLFFFFTYYILSYTLSLYILIMIHMLEYNAAFIKELVEYQQLHFRLLIKRKNQTFFLQIEKKMSPMMIHDIKVQ